MCEYIENFQTISQERIAMVEAHVRSKLFSENSKDRWKSQIIR